MMALLAFGGMIAVSALLFFIAYGFIKAAEQEGKRDPEAGCGMVMVAMFIFLIIAQMWIVVLTAGQ